LASGESRLHIGLACPSYLLLNPNLRVSEIAFECGFGSLGHFNRTFKEVVGSSPTEYREGLHACATFKAVK